MATKMPAFMFYPGDWMKDPAVRSVSSAARGLWIDCLCLMWESSRRGFLVHPSGRAVSTEQIARMTGNSVETVSEAMAELEDCGVCSRTSDGVIYSRRMERDERKRTKCSEAGKRGGGNPTFKGDSKGGPKRASKGHSKGGPKGTLESESETESEVLEQGEPEGGEPPDWLVIEAEFIRRWNKLQGVAKCSTNALPSSVVNEFQAAWLTPGWWERADEAMRKFPLKNGTVIGLRKFLQAGVIDDIIGGVFDWTRDKPGGGRPTVAEHNADAFREVFGDEDDDGTDDQHETAPPAQGLLRSPGDQGDRGQPADVARRPV